MMPMRVAPRVVLADEQRTTLQRWSRGRATPARLVRRAKIVLLAAEGKENIEIAKEIGVERTIVGRWRRRLDRHRDLAAVVLELHQHELHEDLRVSITKPGPSTGADARS
jgi:DNA-binding NarL/FixJ family response regulator